MKLNLFLFTFLLSFTLACGSSNNSDNTTETGEQSDNAKLITSFSISNVTGIIENNSISLTLPYNTDLTHTILRFIK